MVKFNEKCFANNFYTRSFLWRNKLLKNKFKKNYKKERISCHEQPHNRKSRVMRFYLQISRCLFVQLAQSLKHTLLLFPPHTFCLSFIHTRSRSLSQTHTYFMFNRSNHIHTLSNTHTHTQIHISSPPFLLSLSMIFHLPSRRSEQGKVLIGGGQTRTEPIQGRGRRG